MYLQISGLFPRRYIMEFFVNPNITGLALFKKFCKRDFCDEVRDFKIPEPEAVAS